MQQHVTKYTLDQYEIAMIVFKPTMLNYCWDSLEAETEVDWQ